MLLTCMHRWWQLDGCALQETCVRLPKLQLQERWHWLSHLQLPRPEKQIHENIKTSLNIRQPFVDYCIKYNPGVGVDSRLNFPELGINVKMQCFYENFKVFYNQNHKFDNFVQSRDRVGFVQRANLYLEFFIFGGPFEDLPPPPFGIPLTFCTRENF